MNVFLIIRSNEFEIYIFLFKLCMSNNIYIFFVYKWEDVLNNIMYFFIISLYW